MIIKFEYTQIKSTVKLFYLLIYKNKIKYYDIDR